MNSSSSQLLSSILATLGVTSLLLASCSNGVQETPENDDSSTAIIEIATASDLQTKLAANLAGSFKQTADIDLSGIDWAPIGDNAQPFTGTYSGNGFTISNLSIGSSEDLTDTSAAYRGLFGSISGATLDGIKITDATVYGYYSVAAVAGEGNGGSISNCESSGSIRANSELGGILGASNVTSISDCINSASVESDTGIAGGICGYSSGTISSCSNSGTVTGAGNSVGGIAGYVSSRTISGCSNTGLVSSTGNNVGGIAGFTDQPTIRDCYNYALSSATNYSVQGDTRVGGIVGENNSATISGCFYLSGCVYLASTASSGTTSGSATDSDALKLESTYASWDFTDTWTIDSTTNEGYPYLQ